MLQAKVQGRERREGSKNEKHNVFHCATERMRGETVALVFVSVFSFIPPQDWAEYSVLDS